MASNDDRLPTMLHPGLIRARRVAALALVAAAACGGPKISRQDAAGVIQADAGFKATKRVYLPRLIDIPADGLGASAAARQGEALSIVQMASIDPVVAVLRARDEVTIEDFVRPVPGSEVYPTDTVTKADSNKGIPFDPTKVDSLKLDSARKALKPAPPKEDQYTSPPPAPPLAQAWVHTLRVTPALQLGGADLEPDDGEDTPDAPHMLYSGARVTRTPGWAVNIGGREFVRVLGVSNYTPSGNQPKGEVQVDFLWHWKSTAVGGVFDVDGAAFQSLPREVQQAAVAGSITIDTSVQHWSRATLHREPTGWTVTNVDWTYGDDKPHKGF